MDQRIQEAAAFNVMGSTAKRWPIDLKSIIAEVAFRSVEDRLRLIEEVWESLSASPEAHHLTDAHKEDLQRRLDEHRNDPDAGSSQEEVNARIRGNRK